jgi:hypothetical protein
MSQTGGDDRQGPAPVPPGIDPEEWRERVREFMRALGRIAARVYLRGGFDERPAGKRPHEDPGRSGAAENRPPPRREPR